MREVYIGHPFTKPLKVYSRQDVYNQVSRWQRYTEDWKRVYVDPVAENDLTDEVIRIGLTVLSYIATAVILISMFVIS